MRTDELDKHWENCEPEGGWYCYTCGFYTGQPKVHEGHEVFWLGKVPEA